MIPIDASVRWSRRADHPTATYPGEANLIPQAMEAANAHLRVTDIEELGEAKPGSLSVDCLEDQGQRSAHPLQAPVEVSMIALEVSTSPKREAYLKSSSSSVVG